MSTENYETTIQRAKALIAANVTSAAELARHILPDKEHHVAHVRTLEWLRGAKKMSQPNVMLRFTDYIAGLWKTHGRKQIVKQQLTETTK
jgi:hypothetical protein